ncbi:MAG: MarR family transcriptional regulator [Deltaproteobacteria bacterium]|nr:MarR family transcriptional regulator [Deltaproteobacteria bacterium]
MDALRRIVRALRLAAGDVDRKLGISMAQLFVLQQLADDVPRSLRDLAADTLTDPSSVSAVVKRLVDRKLVARRADHQDARRAQLTLTPLGRRLIARAPEPVQARLVQAVGKLGTAQRKNLAASLNEVAQRMGAGEPGLFFEEPTHPRRRSRKS